MRYLLDTRYGIFATYFNSDAIDINWNFIRAQKAVASNCYIVQLDTLFVCHATLEKLVFDQFSNSQCIHYILVRRWAVFLSILIN